MIRRSSPPAAGGHARRPLTPRLGRGHPRAGRLRSAVPRRQKFVVPNFEKTYAERTAAIEGGLKSAETEAGRGRRQAGRARAAARATPATRPRASARRRASRVRRSSPRCASRRRPRRRASSSTRTAQIEAERQQAVTALRAEVGCPRDRAGRSHRRRVAGRRGPPEPRRRALPRRPRDQRHGTAGNGSATDARAPPTESLARR